jgi:hypothetical protein
MDVFDAAPDGPPKIARPDACETCFLCELYCKADALFVHPDCRSHHAVQAEDIIAAGHLGQYRRDSGWDEFADDPEHANEHWRMENVFALARARTAR